MFFPYFSQPYYDHDKIKASQKYYVAFLPLSIYFFRIGIGASLVFVAGPINIAAHFDTFYSMAIGIVFSGVGVGIFVLPPFIETLITVNTWRGAVLLHGVLILNVVTLGALLPSKKRSSKADLSTEPTKHNECPQATVEVKEKCDSKDAIVRTSDEISFKEPETKWYLSYVQLFTTSPTMVLVYMIAFLQNGSYAAAVTHTYNQIVLNGYSKAQGAWALSLLGAGSLCGRFLHGMPIATGIMLPSTVYGISIFGAALVTFVNPIANNYIGFTISAAGNGFLTGITLSLIYTIIRRKVGTSLLAPAVGLELLSDGLGIMVGGYLAGKKALYIV